MDEEVKVEAEKKTVKKKTVRKVAKKKPVVKKKGGVAKKKAALSDVVVVQGEDVLGRVRGVLLELMEDGASDAVRVAAAKALVDKIMKLDGERDEDDRAAVAERAEALAEAKALLDEIAAMREGEAGGEAKETEN